ARGEGSAEKHSMSLPVIPVPHLTSPISLPLSDDVTYDITTYASLVSKLVNSLGKGQNTFISKKSKSARVSREPKYTSPSSHKKSKSARYE
ncbi:hypothetical protein ADUPG1_000791, partial [Aduncisulcus paluster]